jgi:hypothetical protein
MSSNRYRKVEFSTPEDKLEKILGTTNYAPINEFDALMRAMPLQDVDDVDGFSDLRLCIMDCVDKLEPKDKFIIEAVYNERITYEELGSRLGYTPQPNGSPQAYISTQRALARLKDLLVEEDIIKEFLEGIGYYD